MSEEVLFNCPYCNQRYNDYDLNSIYMEYTTQEQEDTIKCVSCGKTFVVNIVKTIEFYPKKRCNLNGEKHYWGSIGNEMVKCNICGYIEFEKNIKFKKGVKK